MGIPTRSSVDISAPREEVFSWLVEPAKLVTWLGGSGSMPQDRTQLRVGFRGQSPFATPLGERMLGLEVTAWDPPSSFAFLMTYPGGDSLTTYRLTETVTGTTLEAIGDTDWGEADTSAVDAEIAQAPERDQQAMRDRLAAAEAQVAAGDFDASAQVPMQQAVEASLTKLKGLVEAG